MLLGEGCWRGRSQKTPNEVLIAIAITAKTTKMNRNPGAARELGGAGEEL